MSTRPDVIVVTEEGDGFGFAMLVERQGDSALVATDTSKLKPEDREAADRCGDGLVEKMPLERAVKLYRGTDAIWLFDDNSFPEQADKLRKDGEAVIGTSAMSAKMEKDREYAAEFAEEAGFALSATEEFADTDEAIAFLERHKDTAYVCKAQGGDPDLTFVPQPSDPPAIANEELRGYLLALAHAEKKDQPKAFILQERLTDGVEVCCELWLHQGKPLFAWVQLEAKRRLNSDLGELIGCAFDYSWQIPISSPLVKKTVGRFLGNRALKDYTGTIDANVILKNGKAYWLEACFDDTTEILTRTGWRPIKDVPIGTEVATLNRITHELEYQRTTDLIVQDYEGDMIRLGGEKYNVDALATPNHRFYVHHFNQQFKRFAGWSDVPADSLSNMMVLKRDATWRGQEVLSHTIPGYTEKHGMGWHGGHFDIVHPDIVVKMDDWLEFLGWYIAEGSHRTRETVQISQYNHPDAVEAVLRRLPFTYRRENTGFYICSLQLARHLGRHLCYEKRVPRYVTELSSRQIRLFLDAYALGDGSRHKRGGQVTYSTTSPGLADDLQELLLKAGSFANVRKVSVAGTVMRARGKEHRRKHDQYTLGERRERNGFWIVKRKHIRRQPYNGKVYCVSVPNQTIYVRRNGKPLWVSNCWRFGWNQTATILTTARASVKDILSGWLTGKQLTAHFGHQYGGSLSMLVPQQREGAPVIVPRDVVPHFWPYTVQAGPDGIGFGMVGGGRTWYSLGCVVAAAPMPRVAGKRCLELAQRIAYPNRGFRTDLRDSNLPTLPLARLRKLQTMGLLGGTV